MTRIGWVTWDGERTVGTESGRPLPFLWQRFRSHTDWSPLHETDGIEALMPLENGASLWLFADRRVSDDTWEIATSLYVPCPLHPRTFDQRRCEFWAHWAEPGVSITNAVGCAASSCEGCWHDNVGSITSDPGDEGEFWEVARTWGRLAIVVTPGVPAHGDHYDFCIDKGLAA